MTLHTVSDSNRDSAWLVNLVSDCLRVSAREIDPNVPLVRYGMDSLAAIQLTTAISAELRRDVPDELLLDCPDIRSLQSYVISARVPMSPLAELPVAAAKSLDSDWEQMIADSNLPDDIRPAIAFETPKSIQSVLITGATGFLGRYLIRSLLRDTTANLYCLVRPGQYGDIHTRLRANLEEISPWDSSFESRLHVIAGDLLRPELGLATGQFDKLCRSIDAIFHCAAAVNWVFPYAGLRDVNVLSTRELLRMACRDKPKPFHFVSTVATCYSTIAPDVVTERDETFPYLRGIHLGYAQSKCVAETLVRRAGQRGLPVTIYRPGLIIGDRQTGASSPDDLLPTMIKGCIQMGSAPDLDWILDCCPVDYVADAIVALSASKDAVPRAYHLTSSTKRNWREIVLWLNLFGYSIELTPYRDWKSQLEVDSLLPDHPLHRLRNFFLSQARGGSGLTLPELYAEHSHSRVCAERTQQELAEKSVASPALSVRLIDRCITWLVDRGVLPKVERANRPQAQFQLNAEFFESILRRHFADDRLRIRELSTIHESLQSSITTELTSWRYGSNVGLSTHHVLFESAKCAAPESLRLFVKMKAYDRQVLDVCQCVAGVCDDTLGQAFARWKDRIGIVGCHARELAIYKEMSIPQACPADFSVSSYDQRDDLFRRHAPALYGTICDEQRERWILVLEHLSNLELMDSSDDVQRWRREHIESALLGIADIQSIWYGREEELIAKPWLGSVMTADAMSEMADLWTALANYAWRYFSDWFGPARRELLDEWISHVGQWWRALERMPRTLIHNDFNPRNIAFRKDAESLRRGSLRLCAFDWELACLGVPQHDLAELLCFVLTPDVSMGDMLHYVNTHRRALEQATGRQIDVHEWLIGFQLSLRDLIINRFPLYCLVHTFRHQPFLERVIRTWRRLNELTSLELPD
jgi:thioester reductase-like protein